MMMMRRGSDRESGAPALGAECLHRCAGITWAPVIYRHGAAAMIVTEALDCALNLFGRLTTKT
jgi:hypothetical protein